MRCIRAACIRLERLLDDAASTCACVTMAVIIPDPVNLDVIQGALTPRHQGLHRRYCTSPDAHGHARLAQGRPGEWVTAMTYQAASGRRARRTCASSWRRWGAPAAGGVLTSRRSGVLDPGDRPVRGGRRCARHPAKANFRLRAAAVCCPGSKGPGQWQSPLRVEGGRPRATRF